MYGNDFRPFNRFKGAEDFPDDGHFFDEPQKTQPWENTPYWAPVIDLHTTATVSVTWQNKGSTEVLRGLLDRVYGVGCHSMSSPVLLERSERPQNSQKKGKQAGQSSNTRPKLTTLYSQTTLGMI